MVPRIRNFSRSLAIAKSKYKKIFGKELLEHMKSGYSINSFCAVIDVTPATLARWAKVHPEFADYYELAKGYSSAFYEQQLIGLAREGHFGAIKFALERLHPQQWGDKKTVAIEQVQNEVYEIDTGINTIEEDVKEAEDSI